MNPDTIGPTPLFTAEHRDLIRRGLKTQTRRVAIDVKQPYPNGARYMREPLEKVKSWPPIARYTDARDAVCCRPTIAWRWSGDKLNPMFMPKLAARTFVRWTCRGVERVQDISEADCRAEGGYLRNEYISTWDDLNAKRGYPWSSNPLVWVYKLELLATGDTA